MPSSIQCSNFRRLIWSSSQLSWCNTRALRMVLRLVFLGYTPSSLAFCPLLGFETSCRGCSSYTAQPASQCLHRSSISRIGNVAARGVASCEQSFFWKRSTDRGDRLRSGRAYDSCAARQRGQESDTQFTDRNNVTVYSVL